MTATETPGTADNAREILRSEGYTLLGPQEAEREKNRAARGHSAFVVRHESMVKVLNVLTVLSGLVLVVAVLYPFYSEMAELRFFGYLLRIGALAAALLSFVGMRVWEDKHFSATKAEWKPVAHTRLTSLVMHGSGVDNLARQLEPNLLEPTHGTVMHPIRSLLQVRVSDSGPAPVSEISVELLRVGDNPDGVHSETKGFHTSLAFSDGKEVHLVSIW